MASTLNARDGAVTSNMAIVPTTNGSIDALCRLQRSAVGYVQLPWASWRTDHHDDFATGGMSGQAYQQNWALPVASRPTTGR